MCVMQGVYLMQVKAEDINKNAWVLNAWYLTHHIHTSIQLQRDWMMRCHDDGLALVTLCECVKLQQDAAAV